MLDRELGLLYTSGTPHGRATLLTDNHVHHDRHARVRRDVARYRLGRPQQARLVRASICKTFFLSNTKADGDHRLSPVYTWRYHGAGKGWKHAKGGREGRICGVAMLMMGIL